MAYRCSVHLAFGRPRAEEFEDAHPLAWRARACGVRHSDGMRTPRERSGRWIGGANVPTKRARVDASWPLGELLIRNGRLTVRLRRVVRWAGGVTLDAGIEDIAVVFPTRINMVSRVGIRHADGREWYFWAGSNGNREIRLALRDAGFHTTGNYSGPRRG
jgi:hypothetical protein